MAENDVPNVQFIFEPHGGFGTNDPDGNPWPFGYISVKIADGTVRPLFELSFISPWLQAEIDRYLPMLTAAPELYEALADARDRMEGYSPGLKKLIAKTDSALAKARGE